MNKVGIPAIAVVLMLLSHASAQTSSSEWKTVKPGVQVLRLWETTGPEQPQIAILQLTSESYKDLQRDLKAFVDGNKIFPEQVRPHPRLTQMLKPPKGYTGGWVVTCFHRQSRLRAASFPMEPFPTDSRAPITAKTILSAAATLLSEDRSGADRQRDLP